MGIFSNFEEKTGTCGWRLSGWMGFEPCLRVSPQPLATAKIVCYDFKIQDED
jgi:hypothetical protein